MANQTTPKAIFRKLEREIKKGLNPRKINRKILKGAGDVLIDEIKKRVAKGQSPIQEQPRRFPAYKNPKNYPDKVRKRFPQKRRRPVNLYLSGKFLESLKYKVKTGKRPRITIGFFSRKSKAKEKGHREGARGQPKRPVIPERSEQFTRPILRAVELYLIKALDKVLGK